MDKGSYHGRRVNFDDYTAAFFNPFLFGGPIRSQMGCGACALSLLTGVPPENISTKKRDGHYSDDFVVRFLRKNGFQTFQLTLCNLSVALNQIDSSNVVLLSQLVQINEGTWGVIYNGSYYHNFNIYRLAALSFLNKPILSAFLVVHDRWRMKAS